MQNKFYSFSRLILATLLCLILMAAFKMIVYADTDGTEIQITSQPDELILQLGSEWAGMEFQLKTDAGIYPIPVVVDQSGFLKMDLGGSKTYILSSITSNTTAPYPTMISETSLPETPETDLIEIIGSAGAGQSEVKIGIPAQHLALFLGGLVIAAGGLFTLWFFSHKGKKPDFNDDDEFL